MPRPTAKHCISKQADANDEPYELLLLDWKMPGMDGMECAAALGGANPQHPQTGRADAACLRPRRSAQRRLTEQQRAVSALLTKPVTPIDAVRCLQRIALGFAVAQPTRTSSAKRPCSPPSRLSAVRASCWSKTTPSTRSSRSTC
jgi:CheY-like chemotaxis protein